MSELLIGPLLVRIGPSMKKGERVRGHAHTFDHVTTVVTGTLRIEVLDGPDVEEERDEETGAVIVEAKLANTLQARDVAAKHRIHMRCIAKGAWHRLTALEDGTRYECWYPHINEHGEIVEVYEGRDDAYV